MAPILRNLPLLRRESKNIQIHVTRAILYIIPSSSFHFCSHPADLNSSLRRDDDGDDDDMEPMSPLKIGLVSAFVLAFIMLIAFVSLYTLRLRRRQRELDAENARLKDENDRQGQDSGNLSSCSWCFIAKDGKCRWCREAEDSEEKPEFAMEEKDAGVETTVAGTEIQVKSEESTVVGQQSQPPSPSRKLMGKNSARSSAPTSRSGSRNGGPKVVTGISIMHLGSQPLSSELVWGLTGSAPVSRRESVEEREKGGYFTFALDGNGMGETGKGVSTESGVTMVEEVATPPRVMVKHSFKGGRGLYEQSIET